MGRGVGLLCLSNRAAFFILAITALQTEENCNSEKKNTSCFHVENCIVVRRGLHLYVDFGLPAFYLLIVSGSADTHFFVCCYSFKKCFSFFFLMFYF